MQDMGLAQIWSGRPRYGRRARESAAQLHFSGKCSQALIQLLTAFLRSSCDWYFWQFHSLVSAWCTTDRQPRL